MASKRNRKLRLINIVLFWSVRVLTACKNNKTLTFTACKNKRLNNTPREKNFHNFKNCFKFPCGFNISWLETMY